MTSIKGLWRLGDHSDAQLLQSRHSLDMHLARIAKLIYLGQHSQIFPQPTGGTSHNPALMDAGRICG